MNIEKGIGKRIDFSSILESYESFQQSAKDDSLSKYEKIGFPDEFRKGCEHLIFDDIIHKVPLIEETEKTVLDIGCGCSDLPEYLIGHCKKQQHRLLLNDCQEMLDLLPNDAFPEKVPGQFPAVAEDIGAAATAGIDVIIIYSVLHSGVINAPVDMWGFIDSAIELLSPQGQMILGDIPNYSKRRRFLSSEGGLKFHQHYMDTMDPPTVEFNHNLKGQIDDTILWAIIRRAQESGCNAYLVPQNDQLPFSNRRDDILVRKP